MIKEYAIDPESLIAWASNKLAYRYIKDSFGIGTPHLMTDFPKLKNWRKRFHVAAASLDGTDKTRIVELFKMLTERVVSRTGLEYDGSRSWLDNAVKENARHLFSAILTTKNPKNITRVLLSDEIGDWPNELWEAKTDFIVERDLSSMVRILSPLLQRSTEIIFVDPYFKADEKRFREPLIAFLKESISCSAYPAKRRIELHVSADYRDADPPDQFERVCRYRLCEDIPQNIELSIKRWTKRGGKNKFHNRFVLTNLGGVLFATGLDTGSIGETDNIFLLNRESLATRWNQFNNSTEYKLDHEFVIQGER